MQTASQSLKPAPTVSSPRAEKTNGPDPLVPFLLLQLFYAATNGCVPLSDLRRPFLNILPGRSIGNDDDEYLCNKRSRELCVPNLDQKPSADVRPTEEDLKRPPRFDLSCKTPVSSQLCAKDWLPLRLHFVYSSSPGKWPRYFGIRVCPLNDSSS